MLLGSVGAWIGRGRRKGGAGFAGVGLGRGTGFVGKFKSYRGTVELASSLWYARCGLRGRWRFGVCRDAVELVCCFHFGVLSCLALSAGSILELSVLGRLLLEGRLFVQAILVYWFIQS